MDPPLDDFIHELARDFLDGPAVDPLCHALDLPPGTFETSLNSSNSESWVTWIEGVPTLLADTPGAEPASQDGSDTCQRDLRTVQTSPALSVSAERKQGAGQQQQPTQLPHVPLEKHGSNDGGGSLGAPQTRQKRKQEANRKYRARTRDRLQAAEARVSSLSDELERLRMENAALQQSRLAQPVPAPDAAGDREYHSEWGLDAATWRFLVEACGLQDEIIITVRPDAPLRLTSRQIASLPPNELWSIYVAFCNAFAENLLAMKGDPRSPAGKRLEALWAESLQFRMAIALGTPQRVASAVLHTGSCWSVAHEEAEHRRFVAAVKLTEQQRQALRAVRKLLLTNLGILQTRRASATAELQAAQAALPVEDSASGTQGWSVGLYGRLFAAMEALKATCRDEHCLLIKATYLVKTKVLTPIQESVLIIQAFPKKPQIVSMAEVVARDAGDASTRDLLHQGAAMAGAELLPLQAALQP